MLQSKNRIHPDWSSSLGSVLAASKLAGPAVVLAFDLDSTLFDNRPRQARIVREFGVERGIERLTACQARHLDSGWDLKAPMRQLGLSSAEVEALFEDFRRFWHERFFTSAYCVEDVPIPGAPD